MNKSVRLSVVLLLMILSLVALTGFIGFWLNQQYMEEKQELKKKLEQNMADTQRQLVDSLLFKRFIQPILSDSLQTAFSFKSDSNNQDNKELEITRNLEQPGSLISAKKHGMKNIRLELNVNDSVFKYGSDKSSGRMKKTLTIVSSGHSGTKKKIIHAADQNQQLEFKPDTTNVFLMQGMRLILNEIAGSTHLKVNSSGFVQVDSLLFKKLFDKNLKKDQIDISTKLVPLQSKGKNEFRFATNMFARNMAVEALDVTWYLLKQLKSRFLFVTIILGMTALAFVLAYKSLAKQMRLNQMKNDLINNMSHELKTPVATVKVALEALQDERVLSNEFMSRDYLNMATLELNRLELLLGQVLNSSLLEHKREFVVRESLALNDLVEEALKSIRMRADKQGAKININFPEEKVMVAADRTHTLGVILNLLDNALKYGGESPVINISLKKEERVSLVIADNGPGIPPEYINRVFDKFFRVPMGDIHNTKGFGLGLSYARQVMEQQGGFISVRNLPSGGCEFTLTFG